MNIAVIGTGYVGLVTGACFSKMGNRVYCTDNDGEKIANIRKGILPIFEPNLASIIRECQERGNLVFTDDLKMALDETDIIFITVGTPMAEDGSADLDSLFSVATDIARNLSHDALIVVKSTVPVGTCFKIKRHIEKILSKSKSDVKIDIASNPEFLKEGRAIEDFMRPDRVVIGAESEDVFETLKNLYFSFVFSHDRFVLMDIKSSEMTKYVANAMLATKISFMNEIANICELTGADVQKVRLGIGSDNRIGYDFIHAGCGYGGSCFPKDIRSLIRTAESKGYNPMILSDVERVNANQKMVLVDKVAARFEGKLNGRTFGIWGLSFKPGTDDVREATSLVVIPSLIERGAKIRAYDPQASENFKKAIDAEYLESIEFKDNLYDAARGCDGLIIVTEWKEFTKPDFDLLSDVLSEKIIFDGRNIYDKGIGDLGFELYQIGR